MLVIEKIKQVLTEFDVESIELLKKFHIEAGQKASGRTLESFVYDVAINGFDVVSTISGPGYTGALNYGRGTTKAGGSGVVLKNIKQWISDKGVFGILDEKKKTSLAYAITKTIHAKGTYQFRNSGTTQKGVTNPISKAFDTLRLERLKEQITFSILPIISSEVINEFKKQ